jgi:hypothetical protein
MPERLRELVTLWTLAGEAREWGTVLIMRQDTREGDFFFPALEPGLAGHAAETVYPDPGESPAALAARAVLRLGALAEQVRREEAAWRARRERARDLDEEGVRRGRDARRALALRLDREDAVDRLDALSGGLCRQALAPGAPPDLLAAWADWLEEHGEEVPRA